MRNYLTDLITKNGQEISDYIPLKGYSGVTWEMLIDYLCSMPEYYETIKKIVIKIDWKNGDISHYLNHLVLGMAKGEIAAYYIGSFDENFLHLLDNNGHDSNQFRLLPIGIKNELTALHGTGYWDKLENFHNKREYEKMISLALLNS